MNEASQPSRIPSAAQAWIPPKNLIAHHAVRITLHATTRIAEDAWHPKNVTSRHPDGEGGEQNTPDVIQYSADGDLVIYDDRILISYPEPPETGMQNCITNLLWFTDNPRSVEYFRNGMSHFRVCLDATAPIQSVTYASQFGSVEGTLQLSSLQNETVDGVGKLRFSYDLTFTQSCAQHIDMRILIRRLKESEYRPEMDGDIPDMDKRIQATKDLMSLRRLDSHPYPQKKSDPDIRFGMELSELLENLADEMDSSDDDDREGNA